MMIEGISTPNIAVFVFTSSRPLAKLDAITDQHKREELEGLFRRFHCVVTIPTLNKATAEAFLLPFLNDYVPLPDEESLRKLDYWKPFEEAWCSWDEQAAAPFDMLSKYMARAVREFYVDRNVRTGDRLGWSGRALSSPEQSAFLRTVMSSRSVKAFLGEYAGGVHLSKFER